MIVSTADAIAQCDASIQLLATTHEISPEAPKAVYCSMAWIHIGAAMAGAVYGMKQVGSLLAHPGISGKVLGKYSAIKPRPLDNDLAKTFSGAKYQEVVLQQDTILYRGVV